MTSALRGFNPAPVPGQAEQVRLHLGCGRTILKGWCNIDQTKGPGVDLVADLGMCRHQSLPFDADSVDEFFMSHVIEHIRDTLALMQELHRIAKPGAKLVARVPYGSSDDAWEDPTHVRAYFIQSWGYFSQPYFWKAQYNTTDEYDLFGNRVHPNRLCPWFVRGPLSPSAQDRKDWRNIYQEAHAGGGMLGDGVRSATLRARDVSPSLSAREEERGARTDTEFSDANSGKVFSQEMRAEILREGILSSPLAAGMGGEGTGADNSEAEKAEREGAIHDRGILACERSPQPREKDCRASFGDGAAFGASTVSVGERTPQERQCAYEWATELGALVQTAASRSKSRGLTELANLLIPHRIEKTPELGKRGCVCTPVDYGYRGDWQPETLELMVDKAANQNLTPDLILKRVFAERNVVREMTVVLRAVKPIREPKRELQVLPKINFVTV